METAKSDYIYSVKDQNWKAPAVDHLQTYGFLVLRDCVAPKTLSAAQQKIKEILAKPSIGGSIGYYMKDPYKKTFDGLLIGKSALEIVANLNVIETVEAYLKEEVLITEIFLKHDLGSNMLYFPYHCHTGEDLIKDNTKDPFGCGTMCYTHDTEEGAFCYSPKTHKLASPHGSNPYKYPESMKSEILDNMVRISGKAGDIVLFDEAGFHGPEQPVRKPRTVFIYGYQNKKFSNNTVRSPAPVLIPDLKTLNSKQLNVLGINAGSRKPFSDYHIRSYDKHPSYSKLRKAFINHFKKELTTAQFKIMIKKLLPLKGK